MRSALASLLASLNGVRDIADDIDAHAAEALKDSAVRRRHETVQCASTVILSGYFESFLRDTAEGCVGQICALGAPFTTLEPAIRKAHFEDGATVLQRAAKASKGHSVTWVTAPVEDIVRRLYSVTQGVPYEIVWEAFADTRSNPNPDVVNDFMKRFGVTKTWDQFAAKTKLSSSWLRDALKDFLRIRNECAHTGTADVIPLPSDIRQYCGLLQTLATSVIEVLEDHLSTFHGATVAPPAPPNGTAASPVAIAATSSQAGPP